MRRFGAIPCPNCNPAAEEACPRCGQVCRFDGLGWVHADGFVIDSCPPVVSQADGELREELSRWLAWGYGGDDYADQAGDNEHWREMADLVIALPAVQRLIAAEANCNPAAKEASA